jgi:hypothetical protein
MKTIFISLILFSFSTLFSQRLKVEYIGYIEKCTYDSVGTKHCYSDPTKPEYKWFNKYIIKIQGDSVNARSSSICIYKNDTLYSASDGRFYNYTGTIKVIKDSVIIKLVETSCDYCPVIVNKGGAITTRKIEFKGFLREKSLILEEQEFR